MASTNFKIFAESATNILSDAEYEADTQRSQGVVPGIAEPELHNKLYKQATMMGAAIAQVLVERGFNAMDNNYTGLVAALRQAFPKSINNYTADANGNIDYDLLSFDDVYPVGSVYTSVNNTNPSTLFGGTWEQIAAGRCLIGAGDGYVAGHTGGEKEHILSTDEMPSHKHTATTAAAGDHRHNRGTMNITGTFGNCEESGSKIDGAFKEIATSEGAAYHSAGGFNISFDASRSWTGETSKDGAHTHTVSVGNSGSNKAHNNMQPYLVVYFWKRTA